MSLRRAAPWALALFLATPGLAQATTLDEAIAAALAHAPEIAAADAEGDAAKGRLQQAQSARAPSLSLSGTVGQGRLDPKEFFGLGAADVTPRAAQLTLEQPLFTGGRAAAGIARARAGMAAADAGGDAVQGQVVLAVVQAYGDMLAASEVLRLYRELAAQTVEIERQARERFRTGETPSTDVAQAASRAAEARADLARAEGMQASARARYRNLTDLESVDLQPIPPNPPLPGSLDDAMAIAMGGSPALRQARANLEAAEAAARAARGERLPTVSAFVEAGSVRDQFFPDYRADSATVGIRGRWTLFSGGLTSGKIAETSADVRAASARLRAARMGLEEQVLAAWQDIHTAELVAKASDEQSAAAVQALTSVRHEVRVGLKPQIDLLNAEREATAAAAAATQAKTARIVAAYRLKSLIGSALG
ncbi:TolC family protein [Brevundimonas mediterranea]|uniref:Outer membrane protein n=1 Tax=Brevundimonas mediterranea TaxID=74329 RepID=A0A7W6EZ42_9CAUL|nr:TolC family protein [Brevundimonas mediterranea]MBB3871631.1 outer membrane protein [Brevundimonas mediterranea]